MSQLTFHVTMEEEGPGGVRTLGADAFDEGGRFRIVFATAGVQASKTPEAFETDETTTDGLRRAIEAKVKCFYAAPNAHVRVEQQPKG